MQTTAHLLMIRPVNFSFNAATAVNNAFQVPASDDRTQERALAEFEGLVKALRDNGVDVTVINDTPEPYTPDSIFPNNWVSFHQDGVVCLYPMYAVNRREERKPGVLQELGRKFDLRTTLDFSPYEKEGLFLEGTGSMVLDRDNKIAYACLSPRTDKKVLEDFCEKMGYRPLVFTSVDGKGLPIYHTNVMMCVADRYVVVCLDSLPVVAERALLSATIKDSGKEIIEITPEQMNHFAGNMLQVHNAREEKLLVMSTQAYQSLTPAQVERLRSFNRILHAPLTTIETNGGGSARCMLAEVHLRMKSLIFAALFFFSTLAGFTQSNKAYLDSLQAFRENYITTHEVVKTKEDRALLQFFPVDPSYRVSCRFEKMTNSEWFPMSTSGAARKMHRIYGKLSFILHDTTLHLFVYQSQDLLQTSDYKDYLFIPFTDVTSGEESYGAGRYLECYISDIHDGVLLLDFNKAYNPYCAYTTGYNCPIPPRENELSVQVKAGEKNYGKKGH